MNTIYRKAEIVCVWFGIAEKQERVPEAITLLPKIFVASEQTPSYFAGPPTAEELESVRANNLNLTSRYHFLNDSCGLNTYRPGFPISTGKQQSTSVNLTPK
jgi:hypothetical protein